MVESLRRAALSTSVALTLALGGCASVPPRPADPAPLEPAAAFARADTELFTDDAVEAAFWDGFGDPLLARLIDSALSRNHDLRIAVARWDRSRALLARTRADRLPTAGGGAERSHRRVAAADAPGSLRDERDLHAYTAWLDASWELDLFGRVRHRLAASVADAAAVAAELAAVRRAIVGELAAAYFEMRGLQSQLALAERSVANQHDALALLDAREQAGAISALDGARARAQLELLRARAPALQAEIAEAQHRIAVLIGEPPTALVTTLSEPAPLPAIPGQIAVGVPADLLRRRPDVHAAERRLAAASARIGVARAELYPRLSLSGLIGSHANSAGALFARDSETRLLSLGIDLGFLDVARVRAGIHAAEADSAAARAEFEQALLRALADVEDALVRLARGRDEATHLADAVAAADEAARLARLQFDDGAADYLQVLDAERVLLDAEQRLETSRTRIALALVATHRALAGGWMPAG